MDRINNITVNGVTYEVGGTGTGGDSSEQFYFIPNLDDLETFSSTTIKEALGGTSGVEALFQAAKSKKIIVMYNENGGAALVSSRFEVPAIVRLNWVCSIKGIPEAVYVLITRISETANSISAVRKELALKSDIPA